MSNNNFINFDKSKINYEIYNEDDAEKYQKEEEEKKK
jgi:hypothetical protein